MIVLKQAQESEKKMLWNLFQKYYYEMSGIYDLELGESGDYEYPYFDLYFGDVNRLPFLIYQDKTLVGFALVNRYSYLGDMIDHAIAEFTIFPKYRRCHLGLEAAQAILEENPGTWEIKYSKKNKPAKILWSRATEKYGPFVSVWEKNESILSFTVPAQTANDQISFW